MKLSPTSCRWPVVPARKIEPDTRELAAADADRFALAFSLVEVLLVVTLLSLIVLALMSVFSNTQAAFRASVTQTDVLEGSRSAMELISSDLRGLTASGSSSNITFSGPTVVNFATLANGTGYAPLPQTLPASPYSRLNLLNYFFMLGRNNNNQWVGIGYAVNHADNNTLYPLYRFYTNSAGNASSTPPPLGWFYNFQNNILYAHWTNMSHVMDGVVHLVVRARDPRGNWINYGAHGYTNAMNLNFPTPQTVYGEAQIYMFSNTVPAAVELQLGVLEDQAIQRALAFPTTTARTNYLAKQAGRTHIFRQLVSIPNVDPSAYQ